MNLYEEEIRALRTAIEHIDVVLRQPHYKEVEPLLRAKRDLYYQDLMRLIE